VLNVAIQQLDPELPLPALAHKGDAGTDLHARISIEVPPGGGRVLVPTGIAIALPEGYAGFVLPRSGLALKHGISVVNAPGLIDAGYRGELQVIILNTDPTTAYGIERGDRIAQLVIQRVEEVTWTEVASLDENNRGGGFGHSGR
jgi:dUTP pyrophosphatase